MTSMKGETLPPLREDLHILRDAPGPFGEANWVIHDPLQHRYFQIDQPTKELINYWKSGLSFAEIEESFRLQTGFYIDRDQISTFVAFARRNNLTNEDDHSGGQPGASAASLSSTGPLKRLPKSLLFFKVPLFRPQRFVQAALPFVTPLFNRTALIVLTVLAVAGLYLMSRQWGTFIDSFPQFMTPVGAISLGISLIILKALHECGHAFAAARYGCRVPTMGVAFMFLTPMFYTDVSDAWRLSEKKERIWISAAGVAVELSVAIIATFVWSFLPDGALRTVTFVLASTAWIMSLIVNLNPLMKFDGYYILCDLLGFDNLQPRAFALGRWKLRQVLIAPTHQPPEQLAPRSQFFLIVYAWSCWIYRLTIFTALALLAYNFIFKLLGILIFGLIIWQLLIAPVVSELMEWKALEDREISAARKWAVAGITLAVLAIILVPWSSRVSVPAMVIASDLTQFYPERPSKIEQIFVRSGDAITAGSVLFKLEDPEIERRIREIKLKKRAVELKLSRIASSRQDLDERLVLIQSLKALQTESKGLFEQQDNLIIRAPMDGTILQVARNLHPGRWVDKTQLLALFSPSPDLVLQGYVKERDLQRLSPGNHGHFIPDDPTRKSLPVRLDQVNQASSDTIELPALTTASGGAIAVERGKEGELVPRRAQYMVELKPLSTIEGAHHVLRGVVILKGKKQSLASSAVNQVLGVFVRESGF